MVSFSNYFGLTSVGSVFCYCQHSYQRHLCLIIVLAVYQYLIVLAVYWYSNVRYSSWSTELCFLVLLFVLPIIQQFFFAVAFCNFCIYSFFLRWYFFCIVPVITWRVTPDACMQKPLLTAFFIVWQHYFLSYWSISLLYRKLC